MSNKPQPGCPDPVHLYGEASPRLPRGPPEQKNKMAAPSQPPGQSPQTPILAHF